MIWPDIVERVMKGVDAGEVSKATLESTRICTYQLSQVVEVVMTGQGFVESRHAICRIGLFIDGI
jgi:hypothetical protein